MAMKSWQASMVADQPVSPAAPAETAGEMTGGVHGRSRSANEASASRALVKFTMSLRDPSARFTRYIPGHLASETMPT
jgi:hypothetical protein